VLLASCNKNTKIITSTYIDTAAAHMNEWVMSFDKKKIKTEMNRH
jgi:hypothetical protein